MTRRQHLQEETKVNLITRAANDDNYGYCDDIYEINGNINYMRCMKNCTKRLLPGPVLTSSLEEVPTCPYCKGPVR
jgi:NAD-dependent SIR2 family protein deacetylase